MRKIKKYLPFTLPTLMFVIFCMDNLCPSVFLPLMPKIAFSLGVSRVELKQSISMFLVGVFLSQCTIGLYACSIGIRLAFPFLFVCLILGGLCNTQAKDIHWFWLGELLQGFGLGAAYPIVQALIKLHMQDKTSKILSYLGTLPTLMFFFSPLIGMLFYYDWKKIFWLIFAVGFFMLFLSLSLPVSSRKKFDLSQPIREILNLLKNRSYVYLIFLRMGSFIPFYVFLAWLPFLVINDLHINYKIFSYLFIFPTLAMLCGGFIAGLFKEHHEEAFTVAALTFLLAGGLLIVFFFLHIFSVWTLIIACSLNCIAYYLISVHISLAILDRVEPNQVGLAMVFPSLAANLTVGMTIFFLAKVKLNDGIVLGSIFIIYAFVVFFLKCWMQFSKTIIK